MLQHFHGYVTEMHQENEKKKAQYWAPAHTKEGICGPRKIRSVQFLVNAWHPVQTTYEISRLWHKLLIYTPIVAKRASCVTHALMDIFTIIGPPKILQSNNRKEFSIMDRNSSDLDSPLDDQFLDDVIRNIKHLWPEVWMVWGSPQHPESNSGIERTHLTIENKLGTFMKENFTSLVNWMQDFPVEY